jgi:tetratricopeptide (TPR) repeat protein
VASGKGSFYRNGVLFYEGNFSGTGTSSTSTTWLLADGRFARRTTYTDGSIFEIWHPDQSMFIGSIIDIGYYGSISDIKPREGSLLYATGKVISGKWDNGTIKQPTYQYQMKMSEAVPEYVKGRIYYAYKKYADALKSFHKAIAGNLKEDSVYLFRGAAYYSLTKYDSARADLTTLLKKQAKNKEGLTWRAKTLLSLKDTTAALADYSTYIKNFPGDSTGYWQRGVVYHNVKNYEAAVKDYSQYLQRTKAGNDNVYYYRGICYDLLGKKTEACADFETAKKGGNKNADAQIKKLCGNPG